MSSLDELISVLTQPGHKMGLSKFVAVGKKNLPLTKEGRIKIIQTRVSKYESLSVLADILNLNVYNTE